MREFFVVIISTLREGLRKKFLAGLLVTCFLILVLSLFFAQLSLDDKGRLTVDFGLAAVQLLLVALSIFFGSHFIAGDLEKKILWTILTRPIRPSVFFLGRYLGLIFFLFLALLALSLILISFFLFLKIPIPLAFLYTLIGFFLESSLLLAFVLFFSAYVNSFLVLFYCLSLFIIGHFLDSLFYFTKKSPDFFNFIISQIVRFLPNLEKVNWKSAVVYQDVIPFSEFAFSSLYMLLWIGFILCLGLLIMENKEYN